MHPGRLVLLVALVACHHDKGAQLAPLPPDNPAASEDKPKPDPDAKPDGEHADVPVRPVPVGPLDVKIPATATTVKLVDAGKGKRMPLRFTAKPGGKQQVELALDFALKQSSQAQSSEDIVPTVVLAGDAEAVAVEKDGTAKYRLTITKTDARAVAGSHVPVDKFKEVLTTTTGLTFDGTVAANGATNEISLHVDKQGEATSQVMELVRLTLPPWPPLPSEPVGIGAKWRATTPVKLAGKLDVTQVTDYELVSYKANVWTIKGTTKITGADQMMQGGAISKIQGTGASEITIADGALYPNHKATIDATFTASEAKPTQDPPTTIDFNVRLGGSVSVK